MILTYNKPNNLAQLYDELVVAIPELTAVDGIEE
jgi:hypothetical protein